MKNISFQFIKSAVFAEDYPPMDLPEIAIVGRSNAGKSSLINCLAGNKIAKVSGTPGKTRLLNFFRKGEKYTLVDMPGYGFAARSNEEVGQWQKMIEDYFQYRQGLLGMILVMDIRRNWSPEEEMMKKFVNSRNRPLLIALTKSDKLSRNEIIKSVNAIRKQSGIFAVFPISSLKRTGYEEMEDHFFKDWMDAR